MLTPTSLKVTFIGIFAFLGIILVYTFMFYESGSDISITTEQTQNIENNTTTKIMVLNPPDLDPMENESQTTGKISSFLSKPIIANISK